MNPTFHAHHPVLLSTLWIKLNSLWITLHEAVRGKVIHNSCHSHTEFVRHVFPQHKPMILINFIGLSRESTTTYYYLQEFI